VKRIVCAVRGSPQSRDTATRAIDLAVEHGAWLTFFCAVEAEFLSRTTVRSSVRAVYRELEDMAEFAMLILQDRATRRGVAKVDSIIRQGDIREHLLSMTREVQPELLVLGWPLRAMGKPRFKPDELKAFVAELEQVGHTRVELVPKLAEE
jgi:nucleotide-binding universal stress UspA family protein